MDLWFFEKKATAEGFKAIAGIDEAGRGPLAGPVVAPRPGSRGEQPETWRGIPVRWLAGEPLRWQVTRELAQRMA